MAGIPQYSESISDIPIDQQLAEVIAGSTGGTREYCTGYYDTLVQIDGLHINAQKISWTEDPNIEKHTAPGRDGDILHHLGWHSRSVKISAEISGTAAGNVISTMHKKARTKAPVKLTISTLVDKTINGMYVIESFQQSSSTKYPINTADYDISLLSHNTVSGKTQSCADDAATTVADSNSLDCSCQRAEGTYTNDATEGCSWCRNGEDGTCCASTNMMQSCSNMVCSQWADSIGEVCDDYEIVNTFSSTDPLTKWCQANLGDSTSVVIQKYTNGYLCYNRTTNRIGWCNNGALGSSGPDHTIPQEYFDDSVWNMVCQWTKGNAIEVYKIKDWQITSGCKLYY